MKTTMLFAFALLALVTNAQINCEQDTLANHTYKWVTMDTAGPPCFPFTCPISQCHYTRMPDSSNAVVEFSNTDEWFELVVLDRCRWVVFDTCVMVPSTTPGLALFNQFPVQSVLLVCGPASASLSIFSKQLSGNFPPFGPPTIDLDTLCGPFVPITENIALPRCYWQIVGLEWRHVVGLRPDGIFKECKKPHF